MKFVAKSSNIAPILDANQVIKKMYDSYLLFPDGGVIGFDDSRKMKFCHTQITVDNQLVKKIFERCPHTEGAALLIDAPLLYLSGHKERSKITEFELTDDMTLKVWRGDKEATLCKYMFIDKANEIMQDYTLHLDETHGELSWISLSEADIEMMKSDEAIQIGSSPLTVVVAKSLFPFFAKAEVFYKTCWKEDSDTKFYLYIKTVREEGVTIISRYECFTY